MDSLTLDHIRKCYGPNTILDNLTYSFPLKEVSVILGKSGCGKTTLLRLKNAHLKKLSLNRSVWFEKLLGEVLSAVTDFPAHLTLADQGRFALGYYHQRQAFFTKSDKTASNEEKQ